MQHQTLFQLNQFLKRVLALNMKNALWVSGEITQASTSKGHVYIELVQKDKHRVVAQAQAILWAANYFKLKRKRGKTLDQILKAGSQVLLLVKVDFHERYGLKLVIQDIDPAYTLGQLALKRQATIEELGRLQLFNKNEAHPLPIVPQRIAVISSSRAAGYQDFLKHLEHNTYQYDFKIRLFNAAMQGELVEKEILMQFKRIERAKEQFDVVVIIRGGGAKLDLSAFDNLELCKAIALFPMPILTGIGHEIDESVADLVAHTALKTPTAVADFIVQRCLNFEGLLLQSWEQIKTIGGTILQQQQFQLQRLEQTIQYKTNNRLSKEERMINYIEVSLPNIVQQKLQQEHHRLELLEKTCELLSPEHALKRGFSITKVNGVPIQAVKDLKEGDIITTQLKDGSFESIKK